ncbi:hypothetical protein ACFY5A_03055 [Microbacterium sp. NPDC012755]|uniref:hypothetical protein n=1 Tax=Microbacterium sp. NPDC012755 TaxID=3364184 RepID=UPI00367E147D
MSPDPLHLTLSRRHFLGAGLLAGALVVLPPSTVSATAAAGDVTLTADGIRVVASVGGRIAVHAANGALLMAGSRFQTKDTVHGIQTSTGGTPTLITSNGQSAIRMDYTMPASAGGAVVSALITVQTAQVHLEWTVSGTTTLNPAGFMFSRAVNAPTGPDEYIPTSEWRRDPAGGIPYEEPTGVVYRSSWASGHGLLLLDSSRKAWTTSTWVHAPGTQIDATTAVTRASLILTEARPASGAAIGRGDGIAVELSTARPYNIWDAAGDAAVNVTVTNATETADVVTLSWWARTDQGTTVSSGTTDLTVAALSTADATITVPLDAQGMVLLEAAVDSPSGDTAFARTTLAALAPFSYTAGSASMFGIANYPWLLNAGEQATLDLWQKIGIQWVRIAYDGGPGLPPSAYDARGMDHNLELQPDLTASDAALVSWASSSCTTATAAGASWFEIGNELNRPFNTGDAAPGYVERVLKPVHAARAAQGGTFQLMNNGLAGMDRPWLEAFHAAGGWDLVDGIAFHPGRGNFTPDFIPTGDGGEWSPGATGTYWNFLGGLRQLKALMAEYGEKEIWLTEAYACTRPNAWWNDTYRHAAENVLLSLALAKAEGVRAVCWYQFFDSYTISPMGADPEDTEYHFGLVNRDLGPKPSLLAYATAARALDEAEFVRWVHLADGTTHGLLFSTPDGPLAVLWNRADGYVLNTEGARVDWRFPEPEIWQDPWATKTSVSLPATAAVTETDSFGRTAHIPSTGGQVQLTLDGAPRIYRGLLLDGPDAGPAQTSDGVTVQARREGEGAALVVSVQGDGRRETDVRVTTPLGAERIAKLAAGDTGTLTFRAEGLALASGTATVRTHVRGSGAPQTRTIAYPAFDARPIG